MALTVASPRSASGSGRSARQFAGSAGSAASSATAEEVEDEEEEDEEDEEDMEEEEELEQIGGSPSESCVSGSECDAPPAMTRQQIIEAKKECLYKLDRLQRHGVTLPRRHNMASDLQEMQGDLDRVQRDRAADASVRFQKRALMTVVSGLEWANSRFDPFDVHLDGWSETVHDNLDDYDEVMEELHLKYQGRGKMPPEIKLLMMVVTSGFMFHMSHAFAKNVSRSMNDAMRNNPDLMRQFAAATAGEMMRGGGGGSAPAPAPAAPATQAAPMRGPSQPAPAPVHPTGLRVGSIQEVMQYVHGTSAPKPGMPTDQASRPPLPEMTKSGRTPAQPFGQTAGPAPAKETPPADDMLDMISEASEESGSVIESVVSSSRKGRKSRRTLVL
jgi:hypothetical protein